MDTETSDVLFTPPLAPAPSGPVRGEGRGKEEPPKKKKDKGKKVGSDRGIETMFRTSYQMHVDMSGLADSKANILISINGLIISVLLAAIAPKIASNPWLLLPTAVVLVSCLMSLSFAILAARPRVAPEPGSRSADPREAGNLMFFGSFVSLGVAEYERGVMDLLGSRDELYRTMIRDIYGLGKVLERKFALLRKAYSIFLAGLVCGVLLYLAVYLGVVLFAPPVRPV